MFPCWQVLRGKIAHKKKKKKGAYKSLTCWLLHGFYFKALNFRLHPPFVSCFEMDPLKFLDWKAAQKAVMELIF